MKALVLGARGAVGAGVVARLRARGHCVTTAGRSGDVDARLDLARADAGPAYSDLAHHHDVVVNVSGVESPLIAAAPSLVDASATGTYLASLRSGLDAQARAVLGAGLVPGLSTVLAADLDSREGDDIDIAVTLGAGERHGDAAVAWTAGLLGSRIQSAPSGEQPVNFRERRRLPTPSGTDRTHLRADFPDHHLHGHDSRTAVRTYLALDRPLTTWVLHAAAFIPGAARVALHAPHVGDDEWAVLAVNRRTDQHAWVRGHGQSVATAALVALAAERLATMPQGHVSSMVGVITIADALRALEDAGPLVQWHIES